MTADVTERPKAVAAAAGVETRRLAASDALNTLATLLRPDLEACNRSIVARMASPVALIPQLAAHIVAAGGKRLRPMLTLASARLCGYPCTAEGGTRHVELAACVEFIHTATLLHDDVVDESGLRRGLASANAVFGNKASVLVGDFLFSRAFQLMTADGSLRVLEILSAASATIAEGEVLQMVTQNDLSTSEARYLEVVHGKTAALFAAACRIGAVLAGRPAAEESALERFGTDLGIAFQLADDALDYVASEVELGKTVGDDFREGKITLPVLAAYDAAPDDAAREFWRRTVERSEQRPEDLDHALMLIRDAGAIELTLRRASGFAARAKSALDAFAPSELRDLLSSVADYAVTRLH